jgi:hypothetical protein
VSLNAVFPKLPDNHDRAHSHERFESVMGEFVIKTVYDVHNKLCSSFSILEESPFLFFTTD